MASCQCFFFFFCCFSTFTSQQVLWQGHQSQRWNQWFWCRCLLPGAVCPKDYTHKCSCWNAEWKSEHFKFFFSFPFFFLVEKTCLPLSNSQFSLVVSVLLELLLQSGTWRLWHSEARKNTEVYSCVIGFGVCLVQWKIHFRYSEPENIVLFIYHSLWIQKL